MPPLTIHVHCGGVGSRTVNRDSPNKHCVRFSPGKILLVLVVVYQSIVLSNSKQKAGMYFYT